MILEYVLGGEGAEILVVQEFAIVVREAEVGVVGNIFAGGASH